LLQALSDGLEMWLRHPASVRSGTRHEAGRLVHPSHWLTAADRWCIRHDLEGLAALIMRPAQVRIERAQIDICFAPEQADIAIRRLALDADPGWVPWLGRVIRFHYSERGPDDSKR
jgi:hypothetical protein